MQPEMRNDLAEQERARRRQLRAQQVQRRRVAFGIVLLGLIVLIIALVIGLSGDDEVAVSTTETTTAAVPSGSYTATLVGAESVPPVETVAKGTLDLVYDADGEKLTFTLRIVNKLTNPSVAAIYQGTPGVEGDAVYTLYVADDPNIGTYQGVLAEGTIVAMDLIGPLQDGTIEDLLELIEDGEAYVSVGNKSHPVDAIRGQIELGEGSGTVETSEPDGETDVTESSEATD